MGLVIGIVLFVIVPLVAAWWLGRRDDPPDRIDSIDYFDPWGSQDH